MNTPDPPIRSAVAESNGVVRGITLLLRNVSDVMAEAALDLEARFADDAAGADDQDIDARVEHLDYRMALLTATLDRAARRMAHIAQTHAELRTVGHGLPLSKVLALEAAATGECLRELMQSVGSVRD